MRAKDRYLRASLSSAFSFSEALLNQISFSHAHANGEKMKGIIKDILEEKESTIDNKGYILRKKDFILLMPGFHS